MKTFKITGRTNGWIAARDLNFNGRTEITLVNGMTLKQAQEKLLDFYNEDYANERGFAPNWGIAVMNSRKSIFGANPTLSDGTRSYEYDSRKYSIEEEVED